MHHFFLTLLQKTGSVSSLVICYLGGGGYTFACSISFVEVKAAHLMKCDVLVLQAGRGTVL